MRFRRWGWVIAGVVGSFATTSSSVHASDAKAVVVDVKAASVDAAHLRTAIGNELHVRAIAPSDGAGVGSSACITIEAEGGKLSVRYVKAAGEPEVLRSVALPDTPERIEASAIILASNVARDEAADLIGSLKKSAPPNKLLPPPTTKQVDALNVLDEGVRAYEKGAKEYRDTVTTVVRLHYEAKKKEVLSGLDREIVIEKTELTKARETAIRRLEDFIAAYEKLPKHEAVADAMFRLAALYEEVGKSEHSIRLYERIVKEHPTYKERAAVHYFLGHALNDAGRVKEANQAWRALVCSNHFGYSVGGATPTPQDHDDAYWKDWQRRYSDPKTFSKNNPETVYQEIYPSDCAGIVPDSKYLAEAWWQIGNWEFEQLDLAAGPWGYNRAESAYARALSLSKGKASPIYAIALYKHAWALYKQQRYELATKDLVLLLGYTDQQEGLTAALDFRRESFTYIAGSIANIEFKGPEAWEPFALRKDILDLEPNPERAEKRLHVAIDRVKDGTIIPQDKAWTIEIYRAVAEELTSLGQFALAVELRTLMLDKWPLHPSAPETQNAIADALDQSNVTRKLGTPEYEITGRRALDARSKLSRYVGSTAWVDANKDNPTALRNAESLVRRGLRQAAVQHTNIARAYFEHGEYAKALPEYRLAGTAWQAYARQEDAPDQRESRYWHADARHKVVMATAKLHQPASKADIDEAILAAVEVRDGGKDRDGLEMLPRDVFTENAAFFVVDLSDIERDGAYEKRAVVRRDDVKFDSADPQTRHVVKDPIPGVVVQSMAARDDFVRVSASSSPSTRVLDYRYYVADQLFLYGHWDAAKTRFESLWREQCGVTTHGHQAWLRLVTMAAKERDADRALALAEAVDPKNAGLGAKSCDAKGEAEYANPVRLEAGLDKARKQLREAESQKKNAAAWREAAIAYERADNASDARAEAKLNAAYAWRRAGEPKKAVALYEKVLTETEVVGSKDRTAEASSHAYDGLLAVHHDAFDYAALAETNARRARSSVETEAKRREAALQALLLNAGLGDRDAMIEMHRVHGALHPSAGERLEADYRVSVFDYDAWALATLPSRARDQAQTRAMSALIGFVRAHEREQSAFLVEASYRVAMLKRDARDPDASSWLKQTVARWDAAKAPSSAAAEHAAEASLLLIDEAIASSFDSPGRHSYPAHTKDVFTKYRANAKLAMALDERLEREVVKKYGAAAPEWVLAAIARQGSIFETLRTGLYNTTKVTYFDAREDAVLRALRQTDPQRASDLEDLAKDNWRSNKRKELDDADTVMVRRYATAAHEARRLNITKNPVIGRALGRLVYFTEILGDSAMERIVTSTPDPSTKGATKLAYTSSMYTSFLRVDSPATSQPNSQPSPP